MACCPLYILVPEKERGEKSVYLTHVTWSLEWGAYLSIEKSVLLEVSEGSSSRSGATFGGTDARLESRCGSRIPAQVSVDPGDPEEDSSSRELSLLHVKQRGA